MSAMNRLEMEWWRCAKCGRKLALLSLAPGSTIEIKCHCNTFNTKTAATAGALATAAH